MASAILVTTSRDLAKKVKDEVEKQLRKLDDITASKAIRENSAIIIVKNLDEAAAIANEIAPEHLELMCDKGILEKINNAGAIFVGEYSCEAAGDYAVGNHVLPTAGFAKVRAGLSVMDFVRMPVVQELSKDGLAGLKETISSLADAEGLKAHKRAVEVRK